MRAVALGLLLCTCAVFVAEARFCILRLSFDQNPGLEDSLATTILRTTLRPNWNVMFLASARAFPPAAVKWMKDCVTEYAKQSPVVVIASHSDVFKTAVGPNLLWPLYQAASAAGYVASTGAGGAPSGAPEVKSSGSGSGGAKCPYARVMLESCFLDKAHSLNPKVAANREEGWSNMGMATAKDKGIDPRAKDNFMLWMADCVESPAGQCGDALSVIVEADAQPALVASARGGPVVRSIGTYKEEKKLEERVTDALTESHAWKASDKKPSDAEALKSWIEARNIPFTTAWPEALRGMSPMWPIIPETIKACGGIAAAYDVFGDAFVPRKCPVPGEEERRAVEEAAKKKAGKKTTFLQRSERTHSAHHHRLLRTQRKALQPVDA